MCERKKLIQARDLQGNKFICQVFTVIFALKAGKVPMPACTHVLSSSRL